jgi:DNA-binding HxlR family transcriptional regulator
MDMREGRRRSAEETCASLDATQAMKRLRGRWKTPILTMLLDGSQRFNELRRRLDPISAKVLAEALDDLRAAGLVSRCERVSAPPKEVVYALTEDGMRVREALEALAAWHRATAP